MIKIAPYGSIMRLFRKNIFLALLLASCTDDPPKLPIPEYMIVSIQNSAEVTLADFIATHSLTGLFYVNGDCSACLNELTGWQFFFAKYPNLSPLLVVRTVNPDIFPLFFEVNGFSFPTLYDYDLSLWAKNHFAAVASLIVLNDESVILYAGKPERDTSFTTIYNAWNNRLIDSNSIH